MKIFMVSSESVPFCKSGGLADVMGALSASLSALATEVRVLLPCYGDMDTSSCKALPFQCTVQEFSRPTTVTFLEATVGSVVYYFLRHPSFTDRKGIYGSTSFDPYPDNLERYALLDQAVLPLCEALAWIPDIIHCHDWTCGFVPYLLKHTDKQAFSHTKSIMTIHNLAYQGDFPRLELLGSGIEPDHAMFSNPGPEKRVNMLQTGLAFADAITTVSPTYAREIQTEEFGCGLEALLTKRKGVLEGIINGIDYNEWNPLDDRFLEHHFSVGDLRGKAAMKELVQESFGLEVSRDVPLVAMISRIAEQKGFVELLDGSPSPLERLVAEFPLQILIIGTGESQMERKLQTLGERYPNLSVNILFSNEAAHKVEAAADFFLMPSRYEPCGLNQLYSLRYGTIPIVRKTGGLADSIIDLDGDPENGTGILFSELTEEGIVDAVHRAFAWWIKGANMIDTIRIRGMESDTTWERSARSYLALYETCSGKGK